VDDVDTLAAAFDELERRMEDQFDDRWSWRWIFHEVLESGQFSELSSKDIEPLWRRWWERHGSEPEQINRQLLAAEHYLHRTLPDDLANWSRYSNLGRQQCRGAWRYEEMRRARLTELDRQGRMSDEQRGRLQAIHTEIQRLESLIVDLAKAQIST